MKTREDYIKEVREGALAFDFEKVFFGPDPSAALRVITPVQTISLLADWHEVEAEKVINAIYPEFNGTYLCNAYWPEVFNSRGAITIQILSDTFAIISIPSFDGGYRINRYQYEELVKFYNFMMGINKRLESLGLEIIELHTNVFDGNAHLDLKKALLYLQNFVSDNEYEGEEYLDFSAKMIK